MWASWIRPLSEFATMISKSALPRAWPPPLPSSATDFTPWFFAAVSALKNVGRIPARRKADQQVTSFSQSFHLTGEDLVESEIIANAGKQGAIGHEAHGGQGRAVIPKMSHQLLGEVHGVSGAAPITTGKNLAARLERGDRCRGNPLEGILLSRQRLQRPAGIFNQLG